MTNVSRELMRRAREAFDTVGVIPTDIAAKLMQEGVSVPCLEDMWMRGAN